MITKISRSLILILFPIHICVGQTTGNLIPKKGLFLSTDDLTWSFGSEVSFFSSDKKHHHYYFTWWEQDIDSTIKDKTVLILGSENTNVNGTYSLQNDIKNKVETNINCKWQSDDDGVCDIIYVKFWLPFLKNCTFNDGINEYSFDQIKDFNGIKLILKTGFGIFRITCSHPFMISRNDLPNPKEYDYDQRAQYLIVYENNIPQQKGHHLKRQFTIEQIEDKKSNIQPSPISNETSDIILSGNENFDSEPLEILPKPEYISFESEFYEIPLKQVQKPKKIVEDFRQKLAIQWQIGKRFFPIIKTVDDQSFENEQYELTVTRKDITIKHKTPESLQHALYTLVQMTNLKNGRLVIPIGVVSDKPKTAWRGIHMFTGPTSFELHKQMFQHILLPLKINKVVLQCEQAEWTSQPAMRGGINISLKDLNSTFLFLKKNRVEPIPLIQSLGHMEWLFKHKSNRRLAVNPLYPYTLNAFLPEARQTVKRLWDETFSLLKPKKIHIGFDEIGMIGFHLPREKEIDLWKTQMAYMQAYVKKKNAEIMIWGDMGLGPGEGPDALNGRTKERAALIRSTIPSGTYIADWHYLGDKDPEKYKTNLKIWKDNRNIPIASPWLHPANVYGLVHAAIEEKVGVLQTTWADFESSEHNMNINIEQFGAYILALDYAWSGRKEKPDELPYHYIKEWNRRYYRQPLPVDSLKRYQIKTTLTTKDDCTVALQMSPNVQKTSFKSTSAHGFSVLGSTSHIFPEAHDVAKLRFYCNNKLVAEKKLRYGVEIRSENDARPIFAHIPGKGTKVLYHFFDNDITIDEVRLEDVHPCSGLNIIDIAFFSHIQ